jgi:hypothetical protein
MSGGVFIDRIILNEKNVLAAEGRVPADTPIVMVNLVAFNAEAKYADAAVQPCSGREAYWQRYAPAFREAVAAENVTGVSVLYRGGVAANIVGSSDQQWDAVAVVRYPSFAAFRKVIGSPLYKTKAAPHREAALRAWEFMLTVALE